MSSGCRAERSLPAGARRLAVSSPHGPPCFTTEQAPRPVPRPAFTCVLPVLPALICFSDSTRPTIRLSTRRSPRTQDAKPEALLPECPAAAVRPWFLPFHIRVKGHRLRQTGVSPRLRAGTPTAFAVMFSEPALLLAHGLLPTLTCLTTVVGRVAPPEILIPRGETSGAGSQDGV